MNILKAVAIGFGLLLLIAIVAGLALRSQGDSAAPADVQNEGDDGIIGAPHQAPIPPIDTSAPAKVETATFALG